jgi:hypothetical protein
VPEGPAMIMRNGTLGRCSCLDWSTSHSLTRLGTTLVSIFNEWRATEYASCTSIAGFSDEGAGPT